MQIESGKNWSKVEPGMEDISKHLRKRNRLNLPIGDPEPVWLSLPPESITAKGVNDR